MKRWIYAILIASVGLGVTACEQAQQAIDTIDKAKLLKNDIEKKTNEIKNKAMELLPESSEGGRENQDIQKGHRGRVSRDKEEADD